MVNRATPKLSGIGRFLSGESYALPKSPLHFTLTAARLVSTFWGGECDIMNVQGEKTGWSLLGAERQHS